jgi:hypothetical protein
MAHHRDTRRSTAGLAFRAIAGILVLALGSTLIACSSAATSSSLLFTKIVPEFSLTSPNDDKTRTLTL